MEANGEAPVRITTGETDAFGPGWSADGTQIAFQAIRDKNYDIESVTVDTRRRIRLTNESGYDGQLAWAPDGKTLTFISDRAGYDAVYTVSASGGTAVRLTAQASLDPRWSR